MSRKQIEMGSDMNGRKEHEDDYINKNVEKFGFERRERERLGCSYCAKGRKLGYIM